jgi:VWFA-related protein
MFACVPLRPACLAVLWLGLCAVGARAQVQPEPTPLPADEIIRVSTELVQTDVVVFDKQGHFVDNLRPEDFELRVDSKPQAVSFFERVRAGSVNEEAQLAAARGGRGRSSTDTSAAVKPLDRGRLIFFFIDDLHLGPASLARTRDLLTHFIDEQLGQNDQVAISTASGQIGFLQQVTDDKDVLHAAVKRLTYRELTVRDNSSPQMSATDALSIQANDLTVINAFVDAALRELPPPGRLSNNAAAANRSVAENQVRGRAAQLLQQITAISARTLDGLQNLMRTTAQLPGRKLVYFISDGFVIDFNQSDTHDHIRRVTDAAVRAGVVVYTLDARGLSAALTGMGDASHEMVDPTGRLGSGGNETSAMQEPLRVIAGETGGRALLNTNALTHAITQALEETSVYYLLAWRPEQDEVRSGRFRRIEVNVRQRPELTVLVQRGFFTTLPVDTTAARKRDESKHNKRTEADGGTKSTGPQAAGVPVVNTINPALVAALTSFAPRTALPTSLTLNYFNSPQYGLLLASSLQIIADPPPSDQSRHIDVLGGIYDEQGHAVNTFERHIIVTPKPATASTAQPASAAPERVILTHQSRIAPGLYQVRIGAHEIESGRTGSATQWITIPALDASKLALSSIFLGERPRTTESANAQAAPAQALVNPERRFSRASVLRFVLYVYNAAHTGPAGAPDVALQLQIFRDDQPVITTPLRKVQTDGLTDFSVLPYAAELDLGDLPAGRYILQAAAIDRTAKTSATQRVKFTVE